MWVKVSGGWSGGLVAGLHSAGETETAGLSRAGYEPSRSYHSARRRPLLELSPCWKYALVGDSPVPVKLREGSLRALVWVPSYRRWEVLTSLPPAQFYFIIHQRPRWARTGRATNSNVLTRIMSHYTESRTSVHGTTKYQPSPCTAPHSLLDII